MEAAHSSSPPPSTLHIHRYSSNLSFVLKQTKEEKEKSS
jgi:hypothetical protein